MNSRLIRAVNVAILSLSIYTVVQPAIANVVTHNFTATITYVSGSPFGLSLTIDQQAQGSFTYDTSLPPSYDTGSTAGYIQSPPSGMSMVISGLTLQSQDYNSFQVLNNSNGVENINGFFTPISVGGVLLDDSSSMSFSFSDSTMTALTSTALPAALDFSSFSQRGGQIYDAASGGIANYSISEVPIPAAVWLFGSGLLGLIGIARRKKSA